MRHGNAVPTEVPRIVSENPLDAVRFHSCGNSCIVRLYTPNFVLSDEFSPLEIDAVSVVQNSQKWIPGESVGAPFWGQSKTISIDRPGANRPKLSNILKEQAHRFVGPQYFLNLAPIASSCHG
jgi:hypothetical protein